MTTTSVESIAAVVTSRGDDESHVYCCEDENRGLCGQDLTGYPETDDTETTCLVCADLDELWCEDFCPRAR